MQRFITEDVFMRSEQPTFTEPMSSTLKELSDRALYDEESARTYFPDLKATVIVGTRTTWIFAWGSLETQRIHNTHVAEGAVISKIPATLPRRYIPQDPLSGLQSKVLGGSSI
ncbi:hypothetical protein E1B28_013778 [Marasmius oreades]|uniref:Uncharacterized protein n=1 Tax=Marasmius oreades TaxID=181124 RepID=A0A9P7RQH9_9AGAR|nr:uncharacterized protein E1B28_013778 [Marasmius oreades]KAG7087840.1 hypothetical protein E1B28_013778 [Marasmius oreades]